MKNRNSCSGSCCSTVGKQNGATWILSFQVSSYLERVSFHRLSSFFQETKWQLELQVFASCLPVVPAPSLSQAHLMPWHRHGAQTHWVPDTLSQSMRARCLGTSLFIKLSINSGISVPAHLFGPVNAVWLCQSKTFCQVLWELFIFSPSSPDLQTYFSRHDNSTDGVSFSSTFLQWSTHNKNLLQLQHHSYRKHHVSHQTADSHHLPSMSWFPKAESWVSKAEQWLSVGGLQDDGHRNEYLRAPMPLAWLSTSCNEQPSFRL